ncbi:ribosome maturation factor rimM [Candidatus Moduliflexus flocculans]|uniref:Ribosome maturation factor RimM n=1 Tax=Candidatus Moduliflexus flocculans TaxID=1499966 RepID=A0A0S6VRQ7_9BACT|nr:ribosome maturation factor rimM [Candidatus Moduliflexus flocculans]
MKHTERRTEWITIGKIVKTRGIRGEVKVLPLTDIPDRFEYLNSVHVMWPDGRVQQLVIENASYHHGGVFLCFEGYSSIEQSEQLVGCSLAVDRATSPKLPEGVYYHYEILDADVYTEQGDYLGNVTDILETGSHDVYVVRREEKEYLIPSTNEIVLTIDREQKKILIRPICGLLEL